jgi:hypothetical protein
LRFRPVIQMDKSRRAAIKRKAYEAMKEFFFIALYLWVIFGLFALYRSVVLAEHHVSLTEKGFALLNALVLGKVMVVAKELHLGEMDKDAPLIYPTLLKSALFSVVLALFKILEEAARGLYRGESFHESIADLAGGTWQAIFCLTLLLFVMLIPFFGFTELQRVLGEARLKELFFRSRQRALL